jgi:hypothetical protein
MRKIREMVQERRGLTGLEFKVLRGGKIMKLLKSNLSGHPSWHTPKR